MHSDWTINKGRGYVPAEENRQFCTAVNVLPIDSIYTPIRNVKYTVDDYRVEQKTDYERLAIEVTTDGSISPKEALKEAAKILIYHFMLFSEDKITIENALNCLKAANVETLGDLVHYNKNDLLKFRNFGKKSLSELEALLDTLNLSFGIDVSKYKFDKD